MISTFVLLTVVGGVSRLGLNWVLRRKLGVSLGLPPILVLALVILISSVQSSSTCLWAWLRVYVERKRLGSSGSEKDWLGPQWGPNRIAVF